MLWLIAGLAALVLALAGGATVHPLLFAFAVFALLVLLAGTRGRGRTAL